MTSLFYLEYKDKENFIKFAKILLEDDNIHQLNNLSDKFESYEKNPESVFSDGWYYYDTINQNLQNSRGTTEELKKNIYWFLLIDNLQFGKYVWEIDWKTPENEIIDIIKVLARTKNYELPEIPTVPYNLELDAGGKLSYFNKTLNKYGLTLINLYIDSDSYVTSLIRIENFKNLDLLAKKTNNLITEY